jgi:hypothetical protein
VTPAPFSLCLLIFEIAAMLLNQKKSASVAFDISRRIGRERRWEYDLSRKQ